MNTVKIRDIEEEPCDLYDPHDNYIGEIKTNLQFNDVRLQIKESSLQGYYIKFKGKKILIDELGTLNSFPVDLFNKNTELLISLI